MKNRVPKREFSNKDTLTYISQLLKGKNASVLDFGCGEGRLRELVEIKDYYGYDIDEKVVAHRTLPDRHFDYIVANHVLEEMSLREIENFLEYASGHCDTLLIGTININPISISEFYRNIRHITPLWWRGLCDLVSDHGFHVEKVVFSGMYVNPCKFLFCLLCRDIPFTQYTVIARRIA